MKPVIPNSPTRSDVRQVYMVLSPHSLPYASLAIESLLHRSLEPLNLHLITDSADDKVRLDDAVAQSPSCGRHAWSVTAEHELDDRESTLFGGLPNLRAFRHGHPCWRKITDPVLLSEPGEELVLLDPDLYFPNEFTFEHTPATGVLLMWQQPNCLLPPDVVRAALAAGVPLARHVDIGVSHWRAQVDLAWLDWLIGKLGGAALPRMMHVEAIVWAAIAMRQGGGYLDPALWHCWHRTQTKRVQRKLGISGAHILAVEPWSSIKCFHAGGEAKWWLPGTLAQQTASHAAKLDQQGHVLPFVELSSGRYEKEQNVKGLLRGLGYHRFFSAGHS